MLLFPLPLHCHVVLVRLRSGFVPLAKSQQYYYFIDFGSQFISPVSGRAPSSPAMWGISTVPYDPFKADVRLVGEMLLSEFLWEYTGLDFSMPFVTELHHDDPSRRPDAAGALARFRNLGAKECAPVITATCSHLLRPRCIFVTHLTGPDIDFRLPHRPGLAAA
ncbi:hypothetical protein B0H13DRAFT_2375618 [Mycena leptocephala]|nr:hypothetical protein B0H13DRAFT_2375618 [Mycena leptocephala]